MKMYFLFNQDFQFCGIVTEKFKKILEHYSSDWIFLENLNQFNYYEEEE